jgi:hypothetical protein
MAVAREGKRETMVVLAPPLGIALLGALLYGFAGNQKAAELGRLLFFVGVWWTVYALSAGGSRLHV